MNAGGCSVTTGRAMDGLNGVKVSPDNRTVYVAASDSNAISTFTRNISSGVATQLGGAGDCISDQPGNPVGTATCTDGVAMIGVRDIALSPNGVNVYGTSLTSRSVTAFGRQLPPQCAGGAVPGTPGRDVHDPVQLPGPERRLDLRLLRQRPAARDSRRAKSRPGRSSTRPTRATTGRTPSC